MQLSYISIFPAKLNSFFYIAVIFLSTSYTPILADTTTLPSTKPLLSARTLFNHGSDFFEQGRYQQAATSFEQARKQGIKTPALFFNLGNIYYKLKNFKQAKKHYLYLRKYPKMRAIAEYNLALVANKLQQKADEKSWLQSVIKNKSNPKLQQLARQKLNKNDNAPTSIKRYSVFSSLSWGQDSNINIAELSGTSLSDSYQQLFLSSNYLLSSTKKDGWFAELSYYQRQYSSETLYDNSEIAMGASKRQRFAAWHLKYNLQQARSTFSGADYQTTLRFNFYANYRLSRQQKLNFSYRYNDIKSETVSKSLQGKRQHFKLEYRHYKKRHNQRASYELELNNRQDSSTASYSPTRHKLRYQIFSRLDNHWRLNADVSLRQSNYPAIATVKRNDLRRRAAISADYRFSKSLKLKSKLAYTNNKSNLATDSYNKRSFEVSLSYSF